MIMKLYDGMCARCGKHRLFPRHFQKGMGARLPLPFRVRAVPLSFVPLFQHPAYIGEHPRHAERSS